MENPDFVEIIKRGNGRFVVADAEVLVATAEEIKAATIMEIGSADGISSMLLGRIAQAHGGHLTCVEPRPKGRWQANINEFGLTNCVTMIPRASPWVPVTEIPDAIDYLFIDGDHAIRSALVDYHYFEPFVRPGGRIAFHDWVGVPNVRGFVARAIEIILMTDVNRIREVGRSEGRDGLIVFEKAKGVPDARALQARQACP